MKREHERNQNFESDFYHKRHLTVLRHRMIRDLENFLWEKWYKGLAATAWPKSVIAPTAPRNQSHRSVV